MREVFHQELSDLRAGLVTMSEHVTSAIVNATEAFNGLDAPLAEKVIESQLVVPTLAVQLDELAVSILARQQPVATDLRAVVASLRISSSLARMADLAAHLAQLVRYRYPAKVAPKKLRPILATMGSIDIKISQKLTSMLKDRDFSLKDEIIEYEAQIDDIHDETFKEIQSDTWTSQTVKTVDATLASRYLERFADHAVIIANAIDFEVTGSFSSKGETDQGRSHVVS
jgi:phosphate transport system protein